MNIPDEAIEAAARELHAANYMDDTKWHNLPESSQEWHRGGVEKLIKAAAPFIAAQALRDAANEIESRDGWDPTGQHIEFLNERADEAEGA